MLIIAIVLFLAGLVAFIRSLMDGRPARLAMCLYCTLSILVGGFLTWGSNAIGGMVTSTLIRVVVDLPLMTACVGGIFLCFGGTIGLAMTVVAGKEDII